MQLFVDLGVAAPDESQHLFQNVEGLCGLYEVHCPFHFAFDDGGETLNDEDSLFDVDFLVAGAEELSEGFADPHELFVVEEFVSSECEEADDELLL
jgi:hypothetical protein